MPDLFTVTNVRAMPTAAPAIVTSASAHSEHPDGVEHCLMLAGFDADDARRYAHLVDATAYRPEVP